MHAIGYSGRRLRVGGVFITCVAGADRGAGFRVEWATKEKIDSKRSSLFFIIHIVSVCCSHVGYGI